MQAIMSGVMTIFYYVLVIAAVWKLFQLATDLGEIKKLLTEMRPPVATPSLKPLPTQTSVPAGPISLESAEALLREVAAESHAMAVAEPPKTAV
jgi:hypothetical protein